ncbi:GNAT family N-acetyltransferase [Clostridium sp. CS001]|uniref:GNAT family N-acetyltransferase n=1 Tax=Clostridium sp. CS001 TaxID=2880648 RepID=UPI001CF2466A|nr:GNAT family N-acetyltransferase [Clostridium sp. CS001]MCB2288948.1 GNAT family N-acetyltransferase [Clostridium sp. CS001]
MFNIRRASICDSKTLTNLAIESESYWGYDYAFMEKFKSIYKVTEEFISNNPTYVIYEDKNIHGFYGVLIGENKVSLEYLFIIPKSIGMGYGKSLWNHMLKTCEDLGIKEFEIVTSPKAKDFYVKLGAKPVGEVDSLVIKGRKIPRLIYTLK